MDMYEEVVVRTLILYLACSFEEDAARPGMERSSHSIAWHRVALNVDRAPREYRPVP